MSDWHSASTAPAAGRLVEIKLRDCLGPYVLPGACVMMASGEFMALPEGNLIMQPVTAWRYLDGEK